MIHGYAVAFGLALLLAADPSMALFSRTADGGGRYFAGNKTHAQERTVRMVQSFDSDWKFSKEQAKGANQINYDDSNWQRVELPHDWSIEGPFDQNNGSGKRGGYLPLGVGWYRKQFELSPRMRDKKVFVQFDGIYKNSDVWINGKHLGQRWYGYSSFQYDLTLHINWDCPNVLAVRVDNSEQTCRWYSGSGIYRHVWLTITDKLHVGHWGTYVTTPRVTSFSATVNIETLLRNEHAVAKDCALKTIIVDPEGKPIATARSEKTIAAGREFRFSQEFAVPSPTLWSVEAPKLHYAHTVVLEGKKVADDYFTPFGIREIRWDPNRGLFVNNKAQLLKGVCIHHDLGCLGAAFHDRAMERRLEVLKLIGCNAIRTSHNPPAPQLLDLCDRMGFLVIDETFDKWGGHNHQTWNTDWQNDLRSMLHRDRNHPSIVLWSVGNEVRQQGKPEGKRLLKMLVDFVHQEEPIRKVTYGAFPRYVPDFVNLADIAGLNYQEQWFEQYRTKNPRQLILSTESYAYYRGHGDSHKAFYPVNPWLDVLKHDFVVGTFYWTGIDYLGEAVAGWPFHGWNCSLIDTCGFRRPVSYLQQSFWSDKPVVHIVVMDDSLNVAAPTKDHWGWPKMVSHWTLPHLKDKETKVVTFTNCQSVELLVNGRSCGTKLLSDFKDRMMTWTIPYEPGIIKAVGKGPGLRVCAHELKTAGEPAKIILKADRQTMTADGRDLCHVEVNITDARGILVPDASNLIRFNVSGEARIIGVDNGDLRSIESYKAEQRKAFYGKCMVILQSTPKPGRIHLAATSPGLSSGELNINLN
jgi:beta-galactosidase